MKKRTKIEQLKLNVIRGSRPRPEVHLRAVTYEDRSKYNRKREKAHSEWRRDWL